MSSENCANTNVIEMDLSRRTSLVNGRIVATRALDLVFDWQQSLQIKVLSRDLYLISDDCAET